MVISESWASFAYMRHEKQRSFPQWRVTYPTVFSLPGGGYNENDAMSG